MYCWNLYAPVIFLRRKKQTVLGLICLVFGFGGGVLKRRMSFPKARLLRAWKHRSCCLGSGGSSDGKSSSQTHGRGLAIRTRKSCSKCCSEKRKNQSLGGLLARVAFTYYFSKNVCVINWNLGCVFMHGHVSPCGQCHSVIRAVGRMTVTVISLALLLMWIGRKHTFWFIVPYLFKAGLCLNSSPNRWPLVDIKICPNDLVWWPSLLGKVIVMIIWGDKPKE